MDTIVIEAALNGGRSRAEHPGVPVSPAEVAAEARRCRDAGAAVVHIHAQDADGRWSDGRRWYAETIAAIRGAAPDLLISITSIRPNGVLVGRVLRVLEALAATPARRPDLISVNLGHIVGWLRQPDGGRLTEHLPNDYADIVAVLGACATLGIVPELGVMDLGFISNAVALRDDGGIRPDSWFLVELDTPGWGSGRQVAPSTPRVYDVLAGALAEQFPMARWAAHGAGQGTWGVVQRAIERGAHVRVGFEDTFSMPDGAIAATNAEQVGWVAARARLLGREPATSTRARAIVGLANAGEVDRTGDESGD